MRKKKLPICFVDDDEREIRRFRENMGKWFTIGAGHSVHDALADVRAKGTRWPSLFLLDIYFPTGPLNTKGELADLAEARKAVLLSQARLNGLLGKLGQTTDAGLGNATQVRKLRALRRTPYAFLSRKATVENVSTALNGGAIAVLKKPDPTQLGVDIERDYDMAMADTSTSLASQIRTAISESGWWWSHREAVAAFVLGLVAGVLSNFLFALLVRAVCKGGS